MSINPIIIEPYERYREALLYRNGITMSDVAIALNLLLFRRNIKVTNLINNAVFLANYQLPDHNPSDTLWIIFHEEQLILQADWDREGSVVLEKGQKAYEFSLKWVNPLMEELWEESLFMDKGFWPTIAQLTNLSKDLLATGVGARDQFVYTVADILNRNKKVIGFTIDGEYTVRMSDYYSNPEHILFKSEAGNGLTLIETITILKNLIVNKKDMGKWLEETL